MKLRRPDKITGAIPGGSRRLAIRALSSARIAPFGRQAAIPT